MRRHTVYRQTILMISNIEDSAFAFVVAVSLDYLWPDSITCQNVIPSSDTYSLTKCYGSLWDSYSVFIPRSICGQKIATQYDLNLFLPSVFFQRLIHVIRLQ